VLLHQTDGDVAAVETLFQQELTRLVAHQTQVPEAAARPAPNWQVHDFVADCPLDLGARFIPQALTVTDLDQDGTAEVWLVYRTTCASTPYAAPAASPSAAVSTMVAPTPSMPPGLPRRLPSASTRRSFGSSTAASG